MILGLFAALLISASAPVVRTEVSWTGVPIVPIHDVRFVGGEKIDKPSYSYWPGSSDVVVFVHGGGWIEGSRNDLPGWMVNFQDAGWTVATIDYRLGPSSYPGNVSDVQAGIERVRRDLGAKRLVVAGWSAGAHLALEAVEAGSVADGIVLAAVPFDPEEFPSAQCVVGHPPLFVMYGMQDQVTPWGDNRDRVGQCGRSGSTVVSLTEGEHDPSASVNGEALEAFLETLK